MSTKDLKDIEIGDRVWISAPYSGDRGDLHTVKHLTPTQIHLDGYKQKFQRGTPSKYNATPGYYGIGFTRGKILSIATPEECTAWDANIERQKAAMDARKQRDEERKAKRDELNELFDSLNISVADDHQNLAGPWRVSIWLSEAGVKQLAPLLRKSKLAEKEQP